MAVKENFSTAGLIIAAFLGLLLPRESSANPTNSAAARFQDWKDAGCRMSPGRPGMPPSEANNAGNNLAYCSACSDDAGQPRWWIDSPYQNLFITDQPLSYLDSAQRQVGFRLFYRQRYRVLRPDECPGYYNRPGAWRRDIGDDYALTIRSCDSMTNALWSHNWMMDVMFWDSGWEAKQISNPGQPLNTIFTQEWEALLFRPEGAIDYFGMGTNTPGSLSNALRQTTLQPRSGFSYPTASGTGQPQHDTNGVYWGDPGVGFTLTHPDGSQDVFGFAYYLQYSTLNSGAPNTTARAFLTQRIDPGGRITRLGYEHPAFTNLLTSQISYPFRLKYVVDPDNRTNTFIYHTNVADFVAGHQAWQPWELSAVVDPYGRVARIDWSDNGLLTAITDAAGNSNSIAYVSDGSGWISSLTTRYGNTSFRYYEVPNTNVVDGFSERAAYVTEPEGAHQLFYYAHNCTLLPTNAPAPSVPGQVFDDGNSGGSTAGLNFRNSFHWDRLQFAALSGTVQTLLANNSLGTALASLTAYDFQKARLKHWLLGTDSVTVTESLSSEREPSLDPGGVIAGVRTWYNYPGKGPAEMEGWPPYINCIARRLPDESTQYIRYHNYDYGTFGSWWYNWETFTDTNGVTALRTNGVQYSGDHVDPLWVSRPSGQNVSLTYSNHQPIFITNSLNQVISLKWDGRTHNLTNISLPSGQTIGLSYYPTSATPSSTSALLSNLTLQAQGRSIQISDYMNGRPRIVRVFGTGLSDFWMTNTWDGLDRLTSATFEDQTTVSNVYDRLAIGATKDRLGYWTYFGYDGLEHLAWVQDARSNLTQFSWCDCGSPTGITDASNKVTTLYYNNQGLLTGAAFPDSSSFTNLYDAAGRLMTTGDGANRALNYGYSLQGLPSSVSNAFGRVLNVAYDALDRPASVTDAEGVKVTMQYDPLNRLVSRTWADSIGERFGYATNGLVAYTNRNGKVTRFARDKAGRLTGITNANQEVTLLGYNALDQLLDLADGRNNHTTWQYNQYGWLLSKTNALNQAAFVYTRDPNGQITNRWTPQFGNTVYKYDPVGNLTNISYPGSSTPSVALVYDALDQLKTMVDGAGTSTFGYTAGRQLQAEDGPWSSDTITNGYVQQLRQALSLTQPAGGSWSQTYGIDSAWRLTSLSSPAGTFNYGYGSSPGSLVRTLTLPNAAWITNHFDSLERMDFTALVDVWGHVLDGAAYGHDVLGLRTNLTRFLGISTNSVAAGYDGVGQMVTWKATESGGASRLHEQLGWTYDKSGNVQYRTNGALVQTFTNDAGNQLIGVSRVGTLTLSGAVPAPATNVTVNGQSASVYGDLTFAASGLALNNGLNTFTTISKNFYGTNTTNALSVTLPGSVIIQFDANGNLTSDGTRTFQYDAENRLVTNFVGSAWKTEFVYDGLGRRRIERDYGWTGSWSKTNELHFLYDGWLLVQVRDGSNNILETFTRGLDFSGSLQDAGGIGGLLARTDGNGSLYYHADGAGNITALIDSVGVVPARYEYNPFGRLVGKWGALADVNRFTFSSKVHLPNVEDIYDYGWRNWFAGLQRWGSRDPWGELGDLNLYRGMFNSPVNVVDRDGRDNMYASPVANTWNNAPPTMQFSAPLTAMGTVSPVLGNTTGQLAGGDDATAMMMYFLTGYMSLEDVVAFPQMLGAALSDPGSEGRDARRMMALQAAMWLMVKKCPGAAKGVTRPTTTVLSDVTVVSKGTVVGRGDVYLRPTLEGIESGKITPRDIFQNREGLLPAKPPGYYQEFVHPTPGVSGAGSQRIIRGSGGELYYTPDHYGSFVPLN